MPVSIKSILLSLGAVVLLLVGIVLISTFRFKNEPAPTTPASPVGIDAEAAAARLAQAVPFQTISYPPPAQPDSNAFRALHAYLEQAFPRVHAALKRETVAGLSLLYTWPGQDTTLQPIVLMAHQDVVPIDAGSEGDWSQPPFAGTIQDGYVWGRGTLDDKVGVLGLLEAVEQLLQASFTPTRTVYLAFGHDEEIRGEQGAEQIAALLAARHVAPAFVLDEGGAILEGVIPGVDAPVALIGTAEKGYLTLELTVEEEGGHAARPPTHTAVGLISRAVTRLEAAPLPARFDGATAEMFEYVGPSMPFVQRMAFANLWLFRPLVLRILHGDRNTDATIRTTTAATMIQGGEKENVLPTHASATVNFRILPGETVDQVIEHVRRTIDDPLVHIQTLGTASDPSPVSSSHTAAFRLIAQSIREISPETNLIVAPFLSIGGTDAKHFTTLSDNVYRFSGWKLEPDDLNRLHGTNERIAIDEYARAVAFYYQLLRNSEGLVDGGGGK